MYDGCQYAARGHKSNACIWYMYSRDEDDDGGGGDGKWHICIIMNVGNFR